MSTTETETPYIPADDEVQASSSRQSWRMASGKIQRGKEGEDGHETREKIVGLLKRVGVVDKIFTRDGKDKRVYQVEADVLTRDGMERVKASLCDSKGMDAPSGVAINFIWGLTQIEKDGLFVITTTLGTKKNEFGSFPTFVNFFTLKPGATQGKEVTRRARVDGEKMEITQAKLLDELKTHPAWAERPVHESDDDDGNATTHLSALCKEMEAKGWPSPQQAPTEWLAMVAKARKEESAKGSLSEYTDDQWGEIRQAILQLTDMPQTLQTAKKRLEGTPAAEPGAKNPFADE